MRKLIWTAALSLCIAGTALAQNTCPVIIQEALSTIATNCTDMGRNAVCYGYDRVDAEFSEDHPAEFFTQETDQAGLTDLTTIQTYPLDEINEEFGAAVMNVQANVPDSIPGQSVIFLLLGETQVTNAVSAQQAAQPTQSVAVKTASAATIYRLPSSTSAALSVVGGDANINVDGTNTNGEWVRVIIVDKFGWIARSSLQPSEALENLPDVGPTTRTPMQAFYFTTGIGQSACTEAESTIAVQSPENIEVDLSVNGVDIRVGSLVTFQGTTLTVHRGHVVTSTGQTVQTNETLSFPQIDERGNFTGSGVVSKISDEAFARGQRVQRALNIIAEANGWPTREITARDAVVEAAPTLTPAQPNTNPNPSTDPNRYVVQRGDSLFRIALNLDTSMPEIVTANNLTPPYTLYAGQILIIPNPGSGFVGIDVPAGPPAPGGGSYGGGGISVPAGSRLRDVFSLFDYGTVSQLGQAGAYDCSRIVLYRVESNARATKQSSTCTQGTITTTSVGAADYLVVEVASANTAPEGFSMLTGQ